MLDFEASSYFLCPTWLNLNVILPKYLETGAEVEYTEFLYA